MINVDFRKLVTSEQAEDIFKKQLLQSIKDCLESAGSFLADTDGEQWSGRIFLIPESQYKLKSSAGWQKRMLREALDSQGALRHIRNLLPAGASFSAAKDQIIEGMHANSFIYFEGKNAGEGAVFLAYGDQPTEGAYLQNIVSIDPDIFPMDTNLTAFQNIDIIARLRAFAAQTAWTHMESVTRRNAPHNLLKNQQFIATVASCKAQIGDAVQPYIDARTLKMINDRAVDPMIVGRFYDLTEVAVRSLPEMYAATVAEKSDEWKKNLLAAKLLNMFGPDARKHLQDPDIINSFMQDQDTLAAYQALIPADFSSPEVLQIAEELRDAQKPNFMLKIEKIVPSAFAIFDEADDLEQLAAVNSLSRLLACRADENAGSDFGKALSGFSDLQKDVIFSYALFERYLQCAQSLMPDKFSHLAPTRGMDTDRRMKQLAARLQSLTFVRGPDTLQ